MKRLSHLLFLLDMFRGWLFLLTSFSPGQISQGVLRALLEEFAGPADTGVPSPSVQYTLYMMGQAALKVHPAIDKVTNHYSSIRRNIINIFIGRCSCRCPTFTTSHSHWRTTASRTKITRDSQTSSIPLMSPTE